MDSVHLLFRIQHYYINRDTLRFRLAWTVSSRSMHLLYKVTVPLQEMLGLGQLLTHVHRNGMSTNSMYLFLTGSAKPSLHSNLTMSPWTMPPPLAIGNIFGHPSSANDRKTTQDENNIDVTSRHYICNMVYQDLFYPSWLQLNKQNFKTASRQDEKNVYVTISALY